MSERQTDRTRPRRPEAARDPGLPGHQGTAGYDRERSELISEKAGLAYPIRDGIPIMLSDEARKIDDTHL